MKKLIVPITLITLITMLLIYFWGFPHNLQGISSADLSDIELIKSREPIHIINPETITPKEDDSIIFEWCIAETKARIISIFIVWLISVILIFIYYKNVR